ncbi:hypothetical protein ES703_58263 [subsurface metagenome]
MFKDRVQFPVHAEKASHIESLYSIDVKYLLAQTHTVRSYDPPVFLIPDKELVIVQVIFIYVHLLVGTLSDIAEGDLPEPPYLIHYIGDLYGGNTDYMIILYLK